MNREFPLLEAQQRIHELIARRAPLNETLTAITDWIETMMPGALVSVMVFNPGQNTISMVSGTGFSERYVSAMQDVSIGPDVGTCGRAAYERRPIITEDIFADPCWQGWREAAREEGLGACWSLPIFTGNGELLGTFAAYYRTPTRLADQEQRTLDRGAGLAALALLRDRDASDHHALSQWHQTLFDHIPYGVFTFDLNGHFRSCNAAMEQISGYPEKQMLGSHFKDLVDPDYHEVSERGFDRAVDGESVSYETAAIHSNGQFYFLDVSNFPVIIDGRIVGVYGICRDITQHKKREMELRMLKRGVEANPLGIVMADMRKPDTPLVYVNPAFTSMTGYAHEEVLGRNCRFLQGPETDPESLEIIRSGMREQVDVDIVLRNYRKNGTPFWNRLLISPVVDDTSTCTHFIGIQQDITREKEQEEQLLYQATHDTLTGLPNQVTFIETVDSAFESHQAHPGQLVSFHLDLDGFKPINEGLGYEVGNEVLVYVAQRLKSLAGPEAVVARLIGDEFGILLTHQAHHEPVMELANRILESLARSFTINSQMVHLSASIGIASNSMAPATPHEFMNNAELALQVAKRQGRNTWQWFSGEREEYARHNVTLRHDLLKALEQDQLQMYYQPIVDANSGLIRSIEALVRWHHPEQGMVSPGEFIPLAEQTGQIVVLGQWILRQVCQEITALNARREQPLSVAVNISSLQFHREGFLDFILETLRETGMAPGLLELEVTESVLLDGAGPVIDLMTTLSTMGVRVALDDFGTGFSSLSYMRDLPTHKVKLDRSFIWDVADNHRVAAIVEGVITMAHHMDMHVVAEGIETREQLQDLARRHCDLLQGFYFARPMPLNELAALPDSLL